MKSRRIKALLIAGSMLAVMYSFQLSAKNELDWVEKVAQTTMERSPLAWEMRPHKGLTEPDWSYTYGLVLLGFQQLYQQTGDKTYLDYAKTWVDSLIDENGNIKNYVIYDFNIDDINAGKLLFLFYEQTKDPRYLNAMQQLRKQMDWQPRTTEGGFWHKRIYPWQMWLDGLYMGSAYMAQYANTFKEESTVFDDIAHQFILIESKTRDAKTGLLYHGWDESRLQQWADPETGLSQNFWSRAMGWYAMALVDTLEMMPAAHKDTPKLKTIFRSLLEALKPYQQESGIWLQVTDQVGRKGNYEEASGTAMFAYAIAKGVRLGYLEAGWLDIAQKAFDGITENLLVVDEQTNQVHLHNICGSAGLGGNPFRSSSFDYYIEEPVVVDDAHGIGPYVLAGIELHKTKSK